MATYKVAVQRTRVDEIIVEVEAESQFDAENKGFFKVVNLVRNKKAKWNNIRDFTDPKLVKGLHASMKNE